MKIKAYRSKTQHKRHWGNHLMVMRKLCGPTSNDYKLRRYLYNKGSTPPEDVFYMVGNRYQQLIVDVMKLRRMK